MNFQKVNRGVWVFYVDSDKEPELIDNRGWWVCHFDPSQESFDFMEFICDRIVKTGVAIVAKHSCYDYGCIHGASVCHFYCDGTDLDAHKKILRFLLDNYMIRRTKSGELTDISFEYDERIVGQQRKDSLKGTVQLSHFIDLKTGEWLPHIVLPK